MKRARVFGAGTAAVCLALAACLSSAPPAPPVRWFDPLPPTGDGPPAARFAVVVRAPELLDREFAVRVGPHELAFDADHRWLSPPAQLVQRALQRVGGSAAADATAIPIDVEAFELDRTAAPVARVRLRIGGVAGQSLEERVAAGDGTPAAFADAMATALGRAAERVAALLTGPK